MAVERLHRLNPNWEWLLTKQNDTVFIPTWLVPLQKNPQWWRSEIFHLCFGWWSPTLSWSSTQVVSSLWCQPCGRQSNQARKICKKNVLSLCLLSSSHILPPLSPAISTHSSSLRRAPRLKEYKTSRGQHGTQVIPDRASGCWSRPKKSHAKQEPSQSLKCKRVS